MKHNRMSQTRTSYDHLTRNLSSLTTFRHTMIFSLSVILGLVQWANALTCFESQQSSTVMVGIETKQVESRRGCEYACEQNAACSSFAHSSSNGLCVLHGSAAIALPGCSTPVTYTRWVKKSSGCPIRSDPGAEMGVDKCIGEAPTGTISITFPFCTVRNPDGSQGEVYVIRAITEDGARVTLENDRDARISFDSSLNMWVFTRDYGATVNLVALACAEVDSSSCPCPSLMYPTDISCLSSVVTEQQGACTAPTLRYTQGGAVTSKPMNGQLARVMCKAGEWIVGNTGGNYNTKSLTSACCAAS